MLPPPVVAGALKATFRARVGSDQWVEGRAPCNNSAPLGGWGGGGPPSPPPTPGTPNPRTPPNPPLSDWAKLWSGPSANQNFSLAQISFAQKNFLDPPNTQRHWGGGDGPPPPFESTPP